MNAVDKKLILDISELKVHFSIASKSAGLGQSLQA